MSPHLLRRLADVVGDAHLLTDPDVLPSFTTDWTGRFRGTALAVVRPADTAQVAAVVAQCRDAAIPVIPQGGNTGLVGGGVPGPVDDPAPVLLSLQRLTALGPVEVGQVTADAGVTVADVQDVAAAAGLRYGVDLASRESATVGGTIATNAGGLRVIRYGTTRAQVLGIEAVLADGSVVSHLGGLERDNTGYHIPSLLTGSEGTLGIVTAARLRLWPAPRFRAVALLGFGSVRDAVDAAIAVRLGLPSVEAVELVLDDGVQLVRGAARLPAPLPARAAAYLVVEVAGAAPQLDVLADVVDALAGVVGTAAADDRAGVARLWAYRERHTEAIATLGVPHKLDVTLPMGALAEFAERVPGEVGAVEPRARTWLFGHVADGNLHVNVTGAAPDDDRIDDVVLRLVADYHGSISAEHGVGRAKVPWLGLSRTPAELAAFRALKRGLDPAGILNPGVILPLDPPAAAAS